MGCVAPAVPSKLGWVPRHCWKNFCCFFCVVGYPSNWRKRPRYIDKMAFLSFELLQNALFFLHRYGYHINGKNLSYCNFG